MIKKYLVTYLVDGIKEAVEVEARNEYEASKNLYYHVNFRPSYVDHAILSIIPYEEYGYIAEFFNE